MLPPSRFQCRRMKSIQHSSHSKDEWLKTFSACIFSMDLNNNQGEQLFGFNQVNDRLRMEISIPYFMKGVDTFYHLKACSSRRRSLNIWYVPKRLLRPHERLCPIVICTFPQCRAPSQIHDSCMPHDEWSQRSPTTG